MHPGVDGRALPILEDRRRLFSSEALRRDRAVSSRSELTSVALGDERGEQLPLAYGPLRGSAHDFLDDALNGVPKNAGRYSSVFTTSTAGAPRTSGSS